MQTILTRMNKEAQEIKEMLVDLLTNHSSLEDRFNSWNNGISVVGPTMRWGKLTLEGKQLQHRIFQKYKKFEALLKLLVSNFPEREIKNVNQKTETVLGVIEQSTLRWDTSIETILCLAIEAIDKQIKILEGVYDPIPGENIYIPDTNALLENPNIEKWTFSQTAEYTLLLLPVVLSELDKLKIDGRNDGLRDKAKSLIKKIKEYRRRGNLLDGVPLSGKRKIRSAAIEPNFKNTFSWLDPENNDDRLIAAYFEVVRENPRSNVVLITSDINLQNKAFFAGAIFEETPDGGSTTI